MAFLFASRGVSMSYSRARDDRSSSGVYQAARSQALKAALALVLPLVICGAGRGAETVLYNRDIRPILAENCFACHGPDSASRKGDLRLDRREAALETGAITPGDPSDSELIKRINTKNAKEVMPPLSLHKTLTTEQKKLLEHWVKAALYQLHWSLLAPSRPTLPGVKDVSWVRNPIDRFVLSKLEENGLCPAPEADRRTLARRLSLDLTGLPPRVADVEAFVNDASADAYSTFVDRLMESPAWGEHRARYWLGRGAMPTRTATTSTTIARCTAIATGSSAHSTGTCRLTGFSTLH